MPLSERSQLVLRAVAKQDMDGYNLRLTTGLGVEDLRTSIQELVAQGYLRVAGEMDGSGILKAWYQAVPGALNVLNKMSFLP